MKNLFQKEFLNSLVDNHEFAYNKYRREELIANFSRFKNDTPFSPRLNEWLTYWYNRHKEIFVFVDEDDFDPKDIKGTLQRYIARYNSHKKIVVWCGESDNTIFGEPHINHFFRAWHEYVHITKNQNFSFLGESLVCAMQCGMLPNSWYLERELIYIEIVAQNQFYSVNKKFVENQRHFCISYMINPEVIFTRQE